MVEIVDRHARPGLSADGARGRATTTLSTMAYALVGAAESLADWLADHPDEDPGRTATRLMNAVWLGAGHSCAATLALDLPLTLSCRVSRDRSP